MPNILICGSRTIVSQPLVYFLIEAALPHLHLSNCNHTVIHGGARGVDTLAGNWAAQRGYTVEVRPAQWAQHGKSAGYVRNAEMVALCDCAIALHDGVSRGTQHSINLCAQAGKPCVVVVYDVAAHTYEVLVFDERK